MNNDHVTSLSGTQGNSRTRKRRARAERAPGRPPEDRIRLDTIGRTLSILDATTDPCLGHLMSEDACWRFGHEQWLAAKPPRWNRQQWYRWQREGAWLTQKRGRIEDLARALGLPPAPAPPPPWHRRLLKGLAACLRAPRPGVQ